jgi:hydroxymethylpyrimidine pyrophosphatase-like HAD family hydrolase
MIAIGDGYNDISMLKYAGLGIAMENAPDDIKAACGYVTSSNNEDGVATVIEKFILKGIET